MSAVDVTDEEFEDKVLKSEKPVLVDFWAEWCGPCKMAGPVLDELSEEYKDKLSVVKVNVDENSKTTQRYSIMSIPTVVLFKNGEEVGRQSGFSGKTVYEDLIKKAI